MGYPPPKNLTPIAEAISRVKELQKDAEEPIKSAFEVILAELDKIRRLSEFSFGADLFQAGITYAECMLTPGKEPKKSFVKHYKFIYEQADSTTPDSNQE